MDDYRSSAHRLGFMIPLVLFVLFFVACCGVLASVFIQATQLSNQAGQLGGAVQLCRNQAEIYRALGSSEEALPMVEGTQQLYFGDDYRPAAEEGAAYVLTVTEQRSNEPGGTLRSFTLTASPVGEEEMYSLDVAVYLPDGR